MGNRQRSIIPMIDVNYKQFSPAEKKVADFFITNDEDVDVSAREMTRRLYVSEATLSRFAKKSGFSGYREFAFEYKSQKLKKRSTMTNVTKGVLSIYEDLLDKEYELLDEKQIDKIVQVSVAPLIGAAIKRINENRPVSPLFNNRFEQANED